MIRINLLPHREEKRKERRRQFYVSAGLMFALGSAVWLLMHMVNAGNIERQAGRNKYFQDNIAALDREIEAIKDLRGQIDRLLARKQVIETLQSNRAETVHLLNELAARIPSGVFLSSVSQSGNKIALKGYAQSNARISNMMSSLNESPFLARSEVVKSVAELLNNRRVYSFEINVYIEIETPAAPANEAATHAATTLKG
ncbi:MAG: PilN domain-containing protein [Betaproteobacteria bacterium]|jgi:type IV pilus assembly protein PilN|nr:PilN domain-containing protein [Betaproteobacteria bacterium]